MAESAVDVPRINWESHNLVETWRSFKQYADLMFSGPLKDKSEAEQCSYLLFWVGEKGRDIFNTWPDLAEEDRDKLTLKALYMRFEQHVAPKANPTFARYKFYNRLQGQLEPVEQFITDLKLLAKDCAFHKSNEMIRDRIVFGTNSQKVRELLFSEGSELTLDKAVAIARNYELAKDQLKSMNKDDENIHAIRRRRQPAKIQYPRGPQLQDNKEQRCQSRGGQMHRNRDLCPAKGKTCYKCKKINHFARMCRSSRVDYIEEESTDKEEEQVTDLFIGTVSKAPTENPVMVGSVANLCAETVTKASKTKDISIPDEVFVKMNLVSVQKNMEFKLDTGAQVNVIPSQLADMVKNFPKLQPVRSHLYGYSGKPLDVKGQCKIECRYKKQCHKLVFYLVNTDASPVLSLRSCIEMNLIKLVLSTEIKPGNVGQGMTKEQVLDDYKDVFTGIGLFPGEYRIAVNPDVKPVVHAARKVPIALQKRLKEEINK